MPSNHDDMTKRDTSFWSKRPSPSMPTYWGLANDSLKVVATASALAPVTALQTMIHTNAQMNRRLPWGGILMKTVGTFPVNVKMHTSRGGVSITGKEHTTTEDRPQGASFMNKVSGMAPWVAADDLVSTPFQVWNKLYAADRIPKGFKSPDIASKLYNFGQTLAVGLPLRTVISSSNLGFLFYGADYFTGQFHFKSDAANNALGGMSAGAGAALATGALKGAYDHQLQQTTLDKDTGRLKTMNSYRFFQQNMKQAANMSYRDLFYKVTSRALSDIKHTGLRNMAIFGTIQLVLHGLGAKPFDKIVPEPSSTENGTPESGPKPF